MKPKVNDLAVLRRKLENLHIGNHPKALELAWPHIAHSDRFVRWAALMAIQRLPIKDWADKALTENSFSKRSYAVLSLAKAGGIDPFHRKDTDPPINQKLGKEFSIPTGNRLGKVKFQRTDCDGASLSSSDGPIW